MAAKEVQKLVTESTVEGKIKGLYSTISPKNWDMVASIRKSQTPIPAPPVRNHLGCQLQDSVPYTKYIQGNSLIPCIIFFLKNPLI